MGRYIVQADLDEYIEDRTLVQLTDDSNTGSVSTAIVDECIAGAEDEVDGYLAGLYSVPITGTVPGNITEACVVLACRRLYVRRGRVPETFAAVVEDTMRMLRDIASGKMPVALGAASSPQDTVALISEDRVHTRTTWSGW